MNSKVAEVIRTEKTCFVIMPIADMEGYEPGHFGRVYNHVIKPACLKSGFTPIRADDVASSNYIIVDILRKILDCDMVLCDMSGRNPNVFYELGIRQAFNLPTVLIKDSKTVKIFDIQGIRYTEYREALRVDDVTCDVGAISDALNGTAKGDPSDVNSMIQLLSIKPAMRPSNVEISNDTSMILGALNDLAGRMSSLETQQANLGLGRFSGPSALERAIGRGMERKVGEDVRHSVNLRDASVGSRLFVDGRMIGRLIDVDAKGVLVHDIRGKHKLIVASDPIYSKIEFTPF
jgi:hypothetical protein